MADNIISNEELDNAFAGAEELAAEIGGLSEEQVNEVEESKTVEEVVELEVGDNVTIKDSAKGGYPNISDNDNLKIIEQDGQMATIIKEGEVTTPIFIPLEMLEKAPEKSFNFSEIAPIEEQESPNFNFENVEQTSIPESLPLEYNEYQPTPSTPVTFEEAAPVVEPIVSEVAVEPVALEPEVAVVEEKAEETVEEEVIVEEKGSKPIRWSTSFIDKIRSKRAKRNAERTQNAIRKEMEYAEELLEKELEKAKKEEENAKLEAEREAAKEEKEAEKKAKKEEKAAKRAEFNGKLVEFKNNLVNKPKKLVKRPGILITSMFDSINAKMAEHAKASKLKKEEKIEAKKIKKQEKEAKKIEKGTNDVEEEVVLVDEAIEENVASNDDVVLTGGDALYEEFLKLPVEEQREHFKLLYEGLYFIQKQNEMLTAKLAEAEKKLEEANRVIAEQNNKIEEFAKGNVEFTQVENAPTEEVVENTPVEEVAANTPVEEVAENAPTEEVVENINAVSEVQPAPIEINPDVPTLNETVVKPVRNGIDWVDPIIKAELEANKRSAERAKEIEEAKKKPSKEDLKQALKEGKLTVKVKEEVPTFNEEEIRNDEMNRYSYDREKQAEVEAFWQNQAAYIDNPEYIEAARERATEAIEMQNRLREPEIKKREELIEKNRLQAQKNRVKANLILDNYTPEQIAEMEMMLHGESMVEEESKGRSRK